MNISHKPQFKSRPYESEPAETAYLITFEKFERCSFNERIHCFRKDFMNKYITGQKIDLHKFALCKYAGNL